MSMHQWIVWNPDDGDEGPDDIFYAKSAQEAAEQREEREQAALPDNSLGQPWEERADG